MTELTCNKTMQALYSLRDHTKREGRYRLFSEENSMMLPASWPNQNKKHTNSEDANFHQPKVVYEPAVKQNDMFLHVSNSLEKNDGWPNGEMDNSQSGTTPESNDITHDIQRRLQEQLAFKQREVQEIQQKIAKNKKWGDPRKGIWDRHRHVNKPPIIHTKTEQPYRVHVPDHPNNKKTDRFESASTLDPNSPCFYPSQTNCLDVIAMDGQCGESRENPCVGILLRNGHKTPGHNRKEHAYTGNKGTFGPSYSSDIPFPNMREGENLPSYINEESPWLIDTLLAANIKVKTHDESTSIHNEEVDLRRRILAKNMFPTLHLNTNIAIQDHLSDSYVHIESEWPDRMVVPGMTTNVSDPGRLVVRKVTSRNDKTWSENDFQPSSSNIHCPACKSPFQWPHILSCFHTFCLPCLAKLFDKTEAKVRCPTCSTETELYSSGLEQLSLDFLKCKNMRSKGLNPFSCTCSQNKQAVIYCRECMQSMCIDCQHDHQKNEEMSSHRLQSVKKVKEMEGKYIVETCPDHSDEKLDQYCEDCNKLVCIECSASGQNHYEHQTGDMALLYPVAINRIKIINLHLEQMKNEVQRRMQPLTLLKQDIETNVRLCKQDIHKYSNFLLSETDKCLSQTRQLIDKVSNFTEEFETAQNSMIQTLTEHLPLSEFFNRYLFSATPRDFLSVASLIQNKINKMDEKYNEMRRYDGIFDSTFSFKADYCGLNEHLQNQYNQIIITENLSDALPSDSSELGRRIEKDINFVIERGSEPFSARMIGPSKNEPVTDTGDNADLVDPQSEIFNYNRTSIGFIHQFGTYGRGEYDFVEPSGVLYLLDGCLAVCDTANHRINVYDDHFKYVRTIGQPPNLPPLSCKKERDSRNDSRYLSRTQNCLYFPYRIAQCPRTENIIVIERPPSRDIQIFTVLGEFLLCFGSDTLQHPRGVAVDENGIIVTVEGRTMKLMLFSQDGKLLHRFYLTVHLEFPNDVAARDGLIYISDNRGHCVHVFDYTAEPKRTIGNESVSYYPIGVSLTHRNQVVITDNHNTFNISIFDASDGRYLFGFKSKVRHANCYNVAVHPHRLELAVTSRENQVVIFNFEPLQENEKQGDH